MTTSSPATPLRSATRVLTIEDLRVAYRSRRGDVVALAGVSIDLSAGRALAIVGESGSGKTTLIAAALGLIRRDRARIEGRVEVAGVDVARAPTRELRALRGAAVGFVGQLSFHAFDPLFPIGYQLDEAYRAHRDAPAPERLAAVNEALARAGLPLSPRDLERPPHRMSGGMLQRAQVAAALLHRPPLLLADEPTAALDTLHQRAIADLLRGLRDDGGTALLLATHDLALAAQVADDVLVLRDGREVERGPVRQVLERPSHPYTAELIAAHPAFAVAGGA